MTPARIQELLADFFSQKTEPALRSWFGAHGADFDDDWFVALASNVAALEQQGQTQPAATFAWLRQTSRSAYLAAHPAALQPYIDRVLAADLSSAEMVLAARDDDEREGLVLALGQLGADDLGESPSQSIREQYVDGPDRFTLLWPLSQAAMLSIPWETLDRLTQFHVLWTEWGRRSQEAQVARDAGRLDDAGAIFRECLERAEQMAVPALLAQAWHGLASVAERRGALADARAGYEKAGAQHAKAGQPAAELARRRDVAMVDYQNGHYLEADTQLGAIVDVLATLSDNRMRVQLYYTLTNRATVRRILGRPVEALADTEVAVSLLPQLPVLLRRTVAHIGHQMRAKLFLEEFSPLYDPTRAAQETAALEASIPAALRWLPIELRSQIAFQRREWSLAATLSAEVRRLGEQGGMRLVALFAGLRAAQSLVMLGDLAEAATAIAPVVTYFREEGHSDIRGRAELTLARVEAGLGRSDEAWRLAQSALAEIETGVRAFQSLFDQHRFLQGHLADFGDAFDVVLALAPSVGLARAWSVAERAKGLYLSQLVANADIPLFEGVSADRRREIDELEAALDTLEAAQAAALLPDDQGSLRARWRELGDRRNERLSTMMREHPRWAAVRAPTPPDLEALIARLPKGWRLLSHFWRAKASGGATLHCFSHDANGKVLHAATEWSPEAQGALAAFTEAVHGSNEQLAAYFHQHGGEVLPPTLGELLVPRALREDWTADTRLLVSAHGPSRELPWSALSFDGARLIERVTVQMIPTLGLLTFATPARGFQDVLLLGCERDAFGGAHLPDVPVELAALEKVWKTAGRVVRSQLVSAASADTSPKTWNHFRTIHLACHGSFPEDQPLDAALRLGGTSVRASELFGVRIDADVMSLSACWVGRTSGADEGIGLQLPLIFAGVGRLVASSWPANSALAQRFMTTFHEQLAKGTAVDRAFQQAILPMLKKSPLHWGNWHLTGLPDTSTM